MVKTGKRKARAVLPLLNAIRSVKSPQLQNALLSKLSDDACEELYEMIANVLVNPKVKAATRTRLRKVLAPHKPCLRYMAKKSNPPTLKRRRLMQVGGFPLAAIINAAIPLLSAILGL